MPNAVERPITARTITADEFFAGHKACGGCGGSLAVRLALKVLGPRAFAVLPAGCMAAVGFIYPQMAFANNAIISTFPGTASLLSGIAAGARALGLTDWYAVGFAGDGGTADIGLQALSGAIDRNDRLIYICYDNEAYMNTGVQKSGLTPYGARSTTTPVGTVWRGSPTRKKNLFEIVAAHGIPYAATASVAFVPDYLRKVAKAARVNGTSYIHIHAPCPTGWGHATDQTIAVARQAVTSGLWPLAEYEEGHFILNKKPVPLTPVADYLAAQGRFRHLTREEIRQIETTRDAQWERILATYRLPGGDGWPVE